MAVNKEKNTITTSLSLLRQRFLLLTIFLAINGRTNAALPGQTNGRVHDLDGVGDEWGVVERKGNQFVVGGQPFYFNGFNTYWLLMLAVDKSTRGKVSDVFRQASSIGLTVCRTWAFNDGGWRALQKSPSVYDEDVFKAFDFVLSEARKYKIRLVLPLVNNWESYGGKAQYVRWGNASGLNLTSDDDFFSDPTVKGYYKDHVKVLLNRANTLTNITYKDDPTIFAWELMNEPRCPSDPSGDKLQEWIQEMAFHVKSIDSVHLLGTGTEGFYGPPSHERLQLNPNAVAGQVGTDFIRNHKALGIDYALSTRMPGEPPSPWISIAAGESINPVNRLIRLVASMKVAEIGIERLRLGPYLPGCLVSLPRRGFRSLQVNRLIRLVASMKVAEIGIERLRLGPYLPGCLVSLPRRGFRSLQVNRLIRLVASMKVAEIGIERLRLGPYLPGCLVSLPRRGFRSLQVNRLIRLVASMKVAEIGIERLRLGPYLPGCLVSLPRRGFRSLQVNRLIRLVASMKVAEIGIERLRLGPYLPGCLVSLPRRGFRSLQVNRLIRLVASMKVAEIGIERLRLGPYLPGCLVSLPRRGFRSLQVNRLIRLVASMKVAADACSRRLGSKATPTTRCRASDAGGVRRVRRVVVSSKAGRSNSTQRNTFIAAVYAAMLNSTKRGGSGGGCLLWQVFPEGTEYMDDGYAVVLTKAPNTSNMLALQSKRMQIFNSRCSWRCHWSCKKKNRTDHDVRLPRDEL
ncbi:hypothetical protein C4D60_Mb03t09360 [Musa balbisiana]|uniref:mannan endo-1,4-beta-mannosidase n=1 Tax=Musa balbisiana TaxID=52838 RepID=A0A4V4H5Z9_MUSBA|nr:hypothetical protein C4D60_Mb03t09360 [Musa balbisiana]